MGETKEPDYEAALALAERIKAAYVPVSVVPHWDRSTNTFWYLRRGYADSKTFVYVDPIRRLHRPAFDHTKLAKMLSERDVLAAADSLPFDSIHARDYGRRVSFRVSDLDEEWCILEGDTFEFIQKGLKCELQVPLRQERVSEVRPEATLITFVNRRQCAVDVFWIDWNGNPIHYVKIEPGERSVRPTYIDHVWRVVDSATCEPIASYVGLKENTTALVEESFVHASRTLSDPEKVERGQIKQEKEDGEDGEEARDEEAQESKMPEPFIRDYNLWVYDQVDDTETQVSRFGSEDFPFDARIVVPSPDGAFAFVPQWSGYGEGIRITPRIFDLVKRKEVYVDMEQFDDPEKVIPQGWNGTKSEYLFLYVQRGCHLVRYIGLSTSGHVRTIFEESTETPIDFTQYIRCGHPLCETDEIIWTSSLAGHDHLYLHSLADGALKNQITRGLWSVRFIERVDLAARLVYFITVDTTPGQDPDHAYLACAHLDGTGEITLITPGAGKHTWSWSPDYRYLVDKWSQLDAAPSVVVRDGQTGEGLVVLEEGNLGPLADVGWTPPERFMAPGPDGVTLVHGIIVRPEDFDEARRYPVIEAFPRTTCTFPGEFDPLPHLHELAALGFVVVSIHGSVRGSGCNRDSELADHIAWIRAAAAERPWMDLRKVGIYGLGRDGWTAVRAMLEGGRFYRAAVAMNPTLDGELKSMEELRGRLMLIDSENAYKLTPISTFQVVKALNEAGCDYDLLLLPEADFEAPVRDSYPMRRWKDFFVRHLLGVEPRRQRS